MKSRKQQGNGSFLNLWFYESPHFASHFFNEWLRKPLRTSITWKWIRLPLEVYAKRSTYGSHQNDFQDGGFPS